MKSESLHQERPVLLERVSFRGHPMVLALHPTTIEITTEDHLSRRGDCIVGVAAEKGCAGLGAETREALRRSDARVSIRIVVAERSFELSARGDPGLTLAHPQDMVIRKSGFVSDRTLALGASAAARDIPRGMVSLLRDPKTVGFLEIGVKGLD